MSYGMKLTNQDGTLAYDSTSPGGVFVQYIVLPVGSSTAQQTIILSSAYNNMLLQIYPLNSGDHNYSLIQGNAANGEQARIYWSNNLGLLNTLDRLETVLMVFAK